MNKKAFFIFFQSTDQLTSFHFIAFLFDNITVLTSSISSNKLIENLPSLAFRFTQNPIGFLSYFFQKNQIFEKLNFLPNFSMTKQACSVKEAVYLIMSELSVQKKFPKVIFLKIFKVIFYKSKKGSEFFETLIILTQILSKQHVGSLYQ